MSEYMYYRARCKCNGLYFVRGRGFQAPVYAASLLTGEEAQSLAYVFSNIALEEVVVGVDLGRV